MSKLEISLRSTFPYQRSVSVPLEIIDEQLHRLEGQPKSIRFDDNQTLTVPPGRYLVRAHLPDTRIVSKQVLLADNDGKYSVELNMGGV